MPKVAIRKPVVTLMDKDVTDYLYGYSENILVTGSGFLSTQNLMNLLVQVAKQKDSERFGVALCPMVNASQFKSGRVILQLSVASGSRKLNKRIYQIKDASISEDGVKWIVTETLWPKLNKGFEGFFSLQQDFEGIEFDHHGSGSIYFVYQGGLPNKSPQRPPSFKEKMIEKAQELAVLVECWAIAYGPEIKATARTLWSHDIFSSYWKSEFLKKHGNKYQHILVESILESILLTDRLTGINRIYNEIPKVDLISPLLAQMRSDIIVALFWDETLADLIFGGDKSQYWQRRVEVLFEEYKTPKPVIWLGPGYTETDDEYNDRYTKALSVIIQLIRRPETQEGIREAAKAAYGRITGKQLS